MQCPVYRWFHFWLILKTQVFSNILCQQGGKKSKNILNSKKKKSHLFQTNAFFNKVIDKQKGRGKKEHEIACGNIHNIYDTLLLSYQWQLHGFLMPVSSYHAMSSAPLSAPVEQNGKQAKLTHKYELQYSTYHLRVCKNTFNVDTKISCAAYNAHLTFFFPLETTLQRYALVLDCRLCGCMKKIFKNTDTMRGINVF